MKTTHLILGIAAFSSGLASSCALAGAITSVSFSGPGGTGGEGLPAGWAGGLSEPVLDFTSLNFIDVAITVDSAGTYNLNEAPGFGAVRNHTGQTWLDFDLSVRPGSTGTFVSDWSDSGTPFSTVAQGPLDVYFSNGSVPDGSSSFAPFGHFTTPGAGTFTVRETPSATPEPTSLALIGLGACGAGLIRRRVR